jgi:lipid-A-disaccharide synthase
MGGPLKVMLVATEASADALGAGLAAALKARLGEGGVSFIGVGGGRMAAEGIQSLFSIADLSMVGLVEIAPAVPRVVRRLLQIVQLGVEQQPDVAVLIDSWFFNYLLALGLRRRAPKMALIKYAAPQVWAMRPGRARALARSVDHLMTLFGFEARYFEAEGLATTFVGSPTLSASFTGVDVGAMRAEIGAEAGEQILLILPGSRPSEIKRILPPFEEAAMRLRDARPNLRLVVAAAETVADVVKSRVAGWRHRAHVVEGDAARKAAMCAATVALTKSGTVTTELAMAGCPIVVGYKANPLTAMIGLAIAQVKYLTLFNIAAGEAVAPEFIQRDMTPDKLAAAVAALLDDPARRAAQIAAQNAALAKLGVGAPDPFGAAADVVIRLMRERGWDGA